MPQYVCCLQPKRVSDKAKLGEFVSELSWKINGDDDDDEPTNKKA